MSKAVKLVNNQYLSTQYVVHKREGGWYYLNNLLDNIYPVGSIFISTVNTNPSTYFGGTWERIKGRFLLAADDSTYKLGGTGGEATVKLDLPNYAFKVWSTDPTYSNKDLSGYWQPTGNNYGYSSNYTTNKNTPHNNMPPYLVVYMWKRIS